MPDITYQQLQQITADLAVKVARTAEAIRADAQRIDDEAKDTARIADCIGAMRVDSATVAETKELSTVMAGLSEAVIAYTTLGDTTARQAQAVHQQNHDSYDAINEAFQRSPVGPAIYDVDRGWFRQD